MRYPYETYQLGLGGRLTPAVKMLIIINAGVYLLQQIVGFGMVFWFGLSSQRVLEAFTIWQFGTYMFLHGGFFHLFFNMFILWIFGGEVERHWGTREFVKYYFATGIGAGFIAFFFNLGSDVPIIGASGAIYGVMLAFGMLFPERVITLLIFFVLPVSMKAKHLVMMMALISVFSGITNLFGASDGVAHFAHLGGMAIGYIYLRADWKVENYLKRIFKAKVRKRPNLQIHRNESSPDLQKQVDEILDKINEIGYDKLTQAEKNILKKASDNLSKKSDSKQ